MSGGKRQIARRFVPAALVLAALAGVPVPVQAAGRGIFVVDCFYSHSLPDDPIVFYAKPGASHLHDFYGNRGTNAQSSDGTMRAGGTECRDQADAAGYWNPAPYLDGVRVPGKRLVAGYVNATGGDVETFPAGLQLIGGDSHASSSAANPHVGWYCGIATSPMRSHPYDCGPYRNSVTGVVTFPSCWDGLDIHREDVVYPDTSGTCPGGFGHVLPTLSYRVRLGIADPCLGAVPCTASEAPDENIALSFSSGPTTRCTRTSGTCGTRPNSRRSWRGATTRMWTAASSSRSRRSPAPRP